MGGCTGLQQSVLAGAVEGVKLQSKDSTVQLNICQNSIAMPKLTKPPSSIRDIKYGVMYCILN